MELHTLLQRYKIKMYGLFKWTAFLVIVRENLHVTIKLRMCTNNCSTWSYSFAVRMNSSFRFTTCDTIYFLNSVIKQHIIILSSGRFHSPCVMALILSEDSASWNYPNSSELTSSTYLWNLLQLPDIDGRHIKRITLLIITCAAYCIQLIRGVWRFQEK